MSAARIAAGSTMYVKVPISATSAGNPITLTADAVAIAFTTPGGTPATWFTGTWEGTGTARVLVGPGGALTLTPGTYWVWVKVTDNPEIPAEQVGILIIY